MKESYLFRSPLIANTENGDDAYSATAQSRAPAFPIRPGVIGITRGARLSAAAFRSRVRHQPRLFRTLRQPIGQMLW
jgi:hypothetical protein